MLKPLFEAVMGLCHILEAPQVPVCGGGGVGGGLFPRRGLVALFHPPRWPVEPWLCGGCSWKRLGSRKEEEASEAGMQENFITRGKRVKRQERQAEGRRCEVQVGRPSAEVFCLQ